VSQSIPWLQSQRYWARAGVEVFTSGEVPYIVTNDGEQSRKALEVYLTSLREADAQRQREPMSYVLELGAGSGLFAKLFLDQLRDRSHEQGTDDYARTTYIVADKSPGLLDDTRSSGVFAEHEDRVLRVDLETLALRDALRLAKPEAVGTIRAVHANYLLDSLPFTILSTCDTGLFELQVRTRLREAASEDSLAAPPLHDVAALDVWLDELAASSSTVHHVLDYESAYVRIDRDSLPYARLIPRYDPNDASQQLVHSFGALECLEGVVSLLRPDGYFTAMDYGYDGTRSEPIEFQCFGGSVAAGVNFSQLVELARELPGVVAGVPDHDPDSLHARIFARDQLPNAVLEEFRTRYDKDAWTRTEAPYLEALRLAQAGHYEAARWQFDAAHRLQPYNWNLMEAIVAFLTYTLTEHDAGLEVAKRALQLNHLSPRLWNLLGDCYYGLGAFDSAERAYQQAVRVNPADVRARANLAYVALRRNAPAEALRFIGEALALDRAGECREELMSKQAEALQAIAQSHAQNAFGNINRLHGHHALPCRPPT
jgi:tetratricopeptide (TPR) repeat protein